MLRKIKNKITGFKSLLKFDNYFELIIARIFKHNNLLVYKTKDIEFITDHSAGEENGARDLLTSPMYSSLIKLTDLAENKSLNVLDLGANNGGFPLLLKKLNLGIKLLVSVEMNPNTFNRLRFNLTHNLKDKAKAINAAVYSTDGYITGFFSSGATNESLNVITNEQNNSYKYKIPTFTLNSLITNNFENQIIDLCKIDIEGAEFTVFSSNEYDKIKNCRYIIIETHKSKKENLTLLKKIESLGFSIIKTNKDNVSLLKKDT